MKQLNVTEITERAASLEEQEAPGFNKEKWCRWLQVEVDWLTGIIKDVQAIPQDTRGIERRLSFMLWAYQDLLYYLKEELKREEKTA